MSFLKFTVDDLYWQFQFGKSKNKLTVNELRADLNRFIEKPIFFLSTGRCGTKWFSDILQNHKDLMVLHNPKPSLAHQSKLAYELLTQEATHIEKTLLKEIFLASREQHLRYSYKCGKRYIETNNYITFFTPILLEIFPDAKFVHLYRHPGEFVRSGLRRNYYVEGNIDDLKRIVPIDKYMNWDEQSRIQKISWLWNETNLYIENLKQEHPDRFFDFSFNDFKAEDVLELFEALEIKIPISLIRKMMGVKSNAQKKGNYTKYSDWSELDKKQVIDICNGLCKKYFFEL